MNDSYALAVWLGPCPKLPDSLKDVQDAGRFIDYTDSQIIDPFFHSLKTEEFILKVDELTRDRITDVLDGNIRANITLRLYAGCLESAKIIRDTSVFRLENGSLGTRPIPPEYRKNVWFQHMLPLSKVDSLYKFGVELGPVSRKIRGQSVHLEGIPSDSIVMRYVRAGKKGNVISPEDIVTS